MAKTDSNQTCPELQHKSVFKVVITVVDYLTGHTRKFYPAEKYTSLTRAVSAAEEFCYVLKDVSGKAVLKSTACLIEISEICHAQ